MLWGARFEKSIDDSALEFSSSLNVDINLIKQDLQVSKVHAKMLQKINIISQKEADEIIAGLTYIEYEFNNGIWNPLNNSAKYEDIHSAIESKLFDLIGDTAGKLHSGRSRNDQVVTGLRLWTKVSIQNLITKIIQFQKVILNKADENIETIIPGYTHLQRAQPVSFAFHLLAYYEMLERDKKRLEFISEEADVCPLGSGAVAGSTLPLDRKFTASELGFGSVSENAMDSISDRDFVLDFLNGCTAGMIHLGRLAEEIVLWSTSEWNFIKVSDEYSTGSSLMPQKKNPDIAELIRAKSARAIGHYVSFATVLKGLPLSYNRDLQEDKEPLFASYESYYKSLELAAKIIEKMHVNKNRFTDELNGDFSLATDLADWLVQKGIPFRKAHEITGQVVNYCEKNNKKFNQLTIDELKNINKIFQIEVLEIFDIKNSLSRKQTIGSCNPKLVGERILALKIQHE